MKTCPCKSPSRASPLGRGTEAAGVLLSGTTLILMPKCPMCVAAYVTVISGASVSVTAASHLRTALLVICAAILLGLAAKMFRRVAGRKRSRGRSHDGGARIVMPP